MIIFRAEIYKSGYNYSIDINSDVSELIKSCQLNYIPVKGNVKGCSFKGTLIPRKENKYVMYLNSEIRKKAKLIVGDSIEIEIEFDPESRELPIPEDLELILKENIGNWQKFISLSPSHRRELLLFIKDAKHTETRLHRIYKAIDHLAEK